MMRNFDLNDYPNHVVPPGDYRVSETVKLDGIHLRGSGTHSTRFYLDEGSTGFEVRSPHNRARRPEYKTYAPSRMGAGLSHCAVLGSQSSQRGIVLVGDNDMAVINDVYFSDCDRGAIVVSPDGRFTRESDFQNLTMIRCGSDDHPAIDITLYPRDGSHADGTNNLRFQNCHVVYSFGVGVRIDDRSPEETLRGIYWRGGLLHAHPERHHPLVTIAGRVTSVCFVPDRWVSTKGGKPLVQVLDRFPRHLEFGGHWYAPEPMPFISGATETALVLVVKTGK